MRQPSSLEEEIVGRYRRGWFNVSAVPYMPNPVFLFEMHQLSDTDPKRTVAFRKDIQSFMGLKGELPEILHHRPGRNWGKDKQREKDGKKIDICDEQHKRVRRELLRLGGLGSQWIRDVFLASPDVFVSSRPYLEELLLDWTQDPCGNDKDTIQFEAPLLRFPKLETND